MWFGQWGGPGYAMMGPFGGFLMIAVVVIVIALVVALVRRSPSERPERQRSARDILDERYARGEIDADEYKKRRDDLER